MFCRSIFVYHACISSVARFQAPGDLVKLRLQRPNADLDSEVSGIPRKSCNCRCKRLAGEFRNAFPSLCPNIHRRYGRTQQPGFRARANKQNLPYFVLDGCPLRPNDQYTGQALLPIASMAWIGYVLVVCFRYMRVTSCCSVQEVTVLKITAVVVITLHGPARHRKTKTLVTVSGCRIYFGGTIFIQANCTVEWVLPPTKNCHRP